MTRKKASLIVLVTISLGGLLLAQDPPQEVVGQQAPPATGQPAPQQPPMSPQQLQDLVAPIALYPDTLLSQILAASTYPLEVVEAQQWLQQHEKQKGKKLMEEAQKQNWDPSVQALVAFPGVLARLNQDIHWTTDLGNAFLAQQADVMAAVQQLRARAQASGKLQSNPQENVTTATQNGQSAIEIQPANPEDIYVPDYNPIWAWGPPEVGYYPPLAYPGVDVGYGFFPPIDLGFYFGGGWGLWGGLGWGWGPNWFGGGLIVNPYFFHRFGFRDFHPGLAGNVWAHDPAHRLGVAYPNRDLANRYRGAEGFRAGAGLRGGSEVRGGAEGFRGGPEVRGGAEGFRGGSEQRFGSQGFERQNGAGHSAFGGIQGGAGVRMQSDHGFSSMGHAGFGGGMRGGGGFGGGGMRGGGGGRR